MSIRRPIETNRIPATIEVAPKHALESTDLPGLFPAGTPTYLTDVGVDPLHTFVGAARRLRDLGYEPVAHIPARRIESRAALETRIRALAEDAGVTDVLVIGGGLTREAGPFSSTMEVLETGLLDRYGIRRIGIAGHPEGSPDFSLATAEAALRLKQAFGERTGAAMRIVTQFGFDADSVLGWVRALAASGIDLPVHLGVAGPAKITTLLRYAALCGVGNSVSFLKRQAFALTTIATTHSPEAVVGPIEAHWRADAETRLAGIHIFPFGGLKKSAEWLYERGSWDINTSLYPSASASVGGALRA